MNSFLIRLFFSVKPCDRKINSQKLLFESRFLIKYLCNAIDSVGEGIPILNDLNHAYLPRYLLTDHIAIWIAIASYPILFYNIHHFLGLQGSINNNLFQPLNLMIAT